MGKYVTKKRKMDEKRVVSVRIRRALFESFKGASKAAQKHGYSMSLAGVFESALKDAIQEWQKDYEFPLKRGSSSSNAKKMQKKLKPNKEEG
jgi:hypothetical protein